MTDDILHTLEELKDMVRVLVNREMVRDYYSTDQFAELVHKAEFTVREWCRLGRVHAEKRRSGRGAFAAWVISHTEYQRYQREGLLPLCFK